VSLGGIVAASHGPTTQDGLVAVEHHYWDGVAVSNGSVPYYGLAAYRFCEYQIRLACGCAKTDGYSCEAVRT
jgi:hypothetical protein